MDSFREYIFSNDYKSKVLRDYNHKHFDDFLNICLEDFVNSDLKDYELFLKHLPMLIAKFDHKYIESASKMLISSYSKESSRHIFYSKLLATINNLEKKIDQNMKENIEKNIFETLSQSIMDWVFQTTS